MTKTGEVLEIIEQAIDAMLDAFDVDQPPVPVELMLQRPHEGLWSEVDIAEMSATFLSLHDRFSPRMSVVRLLARHVARSDWGVDHGLEILRADMEYLHMFSRAIVLPHRLLKDQGDEMVEVAVIGPRFEVPDADVVTRLKELGYTPILEEE